ncbi:MAG: DHH family phosphoesterase [Spirochaetales bacterium]|nr:DHH family phosphoesterase [Spirochaetales bacterium]
MKDFLDKNRESISKAKIVYLVMGNEAADLDSMVSSLLYTWLKLKINNDFSVTYIPFIPIPREDLGLRREVVYLFQKADVSLENLTFWGEVDFIALGEQGRLRLFLMDHNKLPKSFSGYESLVEEIIDHHSDEGFYPHAKVRKIEPVGSTCTLVAEELFRLAEGSLEKKGAVLLLGTILLDTVNLDPNAGRVTPKDIEMVKNLLPIAQIDPDLLFETLQREKFHVSHLSTMDLLRKDYKEYTAKTIRYGISAVQISFDAWLKNDPNLGEKLNAYRMSQKLNLLIVMLTHIKPRFQRELILVSESSRLLKKVKEYLNSKDIGLIPHPSAQGIPGFSRGTSCIRYYIQGNSEYSRKKLQPLLQKYLTSTLLTGSSK